MNKFLMALVFCAAGHAMAEPWTGPDKDKHAAVGAVVGAAVALKFDSAAAGCAAASAVGALKEVYDAQNRARHTPSFKDFAATAAFGCISAFGAQAIVSPNSVRLTWAF